MSYLATLFLAAVLLAIFHAVYERVIAPALRLHLSQRLRLLQGRLKLMAAQGALDESSLRAARVVSDAIRVQLSGLDNISMFTKTDAMHHYDRDERFRQRVEGRREALRECTSAEVQGIYKEACLLVERVILVNMGGWTPWVLPFLVIVKAPMIHRRLSKYFEDQVKFLILASEAEQPISSLALC